jgi:hypothetical protein
LIDAHEAHGGYLHRKYDIVRYECGGSLQYDGRTASECHQSSNKANGDGSGVGEKGTAGI